MPASGCLTVLDADVEEDGGLAVKDTASHSIDKINMAGSELC
jgi:hypothetical protein